MKSSVVLQQPLWLKDRLKVKGMMVAVVFVRRGETGCEVICGTPTTPVVKR